MTIFLTIAFAAIALVTINLWREAVRRAPRPSEKFARDLLQAGPIEPKHGKPVKWAFDDDKPLKKWEGTSVGGGASCSTGRDPTIITSSCLGGPACVPVPS